jgi:hypothetical protein
MPFVMSSPMGASGPVIELMTPIFTGAASAAKGIRAAITASFNAFTIEVSLRGERVGGQIPFRGRIVTT